MMQGNTPFWAGEGDVFVYEACEYGDSFLATSPTVAAVTNVEFDHPDWFRNPEAVRSSFLRYLRKPSVEAAILPSGESLRESLLGDVRCATFGEGGTVWASKVSWRGACASFLLAERGMEPVGVRLGAAGDFQVENALCAAAVCRNVGVLTGDVVKGLEAYRGIGRRMERLGEWGGAAVYCDYAHHPTEIALSLATAHRLKGGGRAVTVFQPHTYSRTQALYREFAEALRGAECLAILAPYAARETKDPLQSAEHLSEDLGAIYLPDRERAREWIREHAGKGDAVFLVGAGDVANLFAREEVNPPRECEGQARDSCTPSPP
jgi:UDP-N-acetylmuramate--alanine ligase